MGQIGAMAGRVEKLVGLATYLGKLDTDGVLMVHPHMDIEMWADNLESGHTDYRAKVWGLAVLPAQVPADPVTFWFNDVSCEWEMSADRAAPSETAEAVAQPRRKTKRHPSRADRYSEAVSKIEDGKAEMEELRDELQNWLDNMPEGLRNGDKASTLEESISILDDAINQAEEAAGNEPEFPGMMG